MLHLDETDDFDQGSRLKELLALCLGEARNIERLGDSCAKANLSPPDLGAAKDFAKGRFLSKSLSKDEREVAGVLYYQVLAEGWKRNRRLLSELSENEFLHGCEWVLALPWLDLETRALFDDVVKMMDSGESGE